MSRFSPVSKQFLSIICCNLLVMSFGWSSSWTTINLNKLKNVTSEYTVRGLSDGERSFLVSTLFAGSFTGTCIVVPISQMVGIKTTIHLFGLSIIASSVLLVYAQNVYYLYISRFLCGLVSGALVVGIPTLVNDISNASVRGALNSLYDLFSNTGTIISFFLGSYLNMNMMDQAKTQLIVPIIFVIVMFLLPESPEHWIKKLKEKRAIKSCKFYKGNVDRLECIEFAPHHHCIEAANEITIQECNGEADDEQLTLQHFLTPKAKKAFFVAFGLLILSFISCATVIFNYVTEIFELTGSPISKEYSSLIVSCVQLFANVIFLNIVERFNRRTLYIWSSVLTTVCYCLYGTYCLLWPQYEVISLICFVLIIFISCIGMIPIPYIVAIEIFPRNIRKICLTLALLMMWIVLFALDAVFLIFINTFQLFNCLYILGALSLLNAIFGVLFVPETRGKSYEDIMQLLDR